MPLAKTLPVLLAAATLCQACETAGDGEASSSPDSSTGFDSSADATVAASSGVGSAGDTSTTSVNTTGGDSSTSGVVTGSSGAEDSTTGNATSTTGVQADPVELEDYVANGPEITLPAPGDDASGVAWNYDSNRIWIVENGAARFHEYAPNDLETPIRSVQLGGINGNDTEGIVYLGAGEVAIAFESGYGVYIADVPEGDSNTTIAVKQTLTLAPPPPVSNNGLEGIAYDPDNSIFYAVGEGQSDGAPRRFFRFPRPVQTEGDLSWTDPGLSVDEPFDADSALPGSGGSLDLAGIAFDRRDGNVLIVSHTGSRVIQLDPSGDGTVLGELELSPNQWEGIALVGAENDLFLVAESNELQRFALASR